MRENKTSHSWLKFSVNLSKAPAKLWTLLGECNTLCTVISGIPLLPRDTDKLKNDYLAASLMSMFYGERNTLTGDELAGVINGTIELPPSRKYIAREYKNVADTLSVILTGIGVNVREELDSQVLQSYNTKILDGLVLSDNAMPGQFRTSDGVDNASGFAVPPGDCELMTERLFDWLYGGTFSPPPGMTIIYSILKAVIAHLYLHWIWPFEIGNRRTSCLVEAHIMSAAGAPAPAALLMSAHYAKTESDYRRQIEQAGQAGGKLLPFLVYAIQGFRDELELLVATAQSMQANTLWSHAIHELFRDKTSPADLRRRQLAIELSTLSKPVALPQIADSLPRIGLAYAGRTYKTLTRDVHDLISMGILEKTPDGIRACSCKILGFGKV